MEGLSTPPRDHLVEDFCSGCLGRFGGVLFVFTLLCLFSNGQVYNTAGLILLFQMENIQD
jgi:hypothetical protein